MSALASWQHWVRLRDGTRTAAESERRAPCWLLGEEFREEAGPTLANSTSWTSVYLSPPAHAPVCCGGVAAGEALRSWLLFLCLRVAIVSGR